MADTIKLYLKFPDGNIYPEIYADIRRSSLPLIESKLIEALSDSKSKTNEYFRIISQTQVVTYFPGQGPDIEKPVAIAPASDKPTESPNGYASVMIETKKCAGCANKQCRPCFGTDIGLISRVFDDRSL